MKFKDTEHGDLSNKTIINDITLEDNSIIDSLDGLPKELIGNLTIGYTKITSLEGCPEKIDGNFNCSKNELISLTGNLKEVTGHFNCSRNKLTTLKGCPEKIGLSLNIVNNNLTSLKYCTKSIGGVFICEKNNNLKNIKKQIIKYQIKAKEYYSDEGKFTFENIKEEFEIYGKLLQNVLLQKKINQKKDQKNKIQKIKNTISKDYGLGI